MSWEERYHDPADGEVYERIADEVFGPKREAGPTWTTSRTPTSRTASSRTATLSDKSTSRSSTSVLSQRFARNIVRGS